MMKWTLEKYRELCPTSFTTPCVRMIQNNLDRVSGMRYYNKRTNSILQLKQSIEDDETDERETSTLMSPHHMCTNDTE